ncbi:hypothetical protein M378DRAFT_307494 [Amanita muscaria Koide BX008]|uniref:CCAAT-binding factor domain-containing protein n=1 Tax=Amanita muscaria (strain Koide BX008) TaxID=946122 RepID=A0A0C2SWC4_AMAMK|nr:hypothetical protein M378DRAFT_318889 [Amanita muscaria Koide BX008]KIL58704.1 hypothetical protein M378DRAFT_307494 [Amanita muscaria Koide BX008]
MAIPDSFYTRLYAFLDREVLHLKRRARFFRIIELFLGSLHLHTAILASFVNRLSTLSLSAAGYYHSDHITTRAKRSQILDVYAMEDLLDHIYHSVTH